MRIALIQQHASEDREANLQQGLEAARRAARAGANIVCFAELAFQRFIPQHRATPEHLRSAEEIPGPTTEAFSALARELHMVVVLNLFERAGDKTYDSSPVIDADGALLGRTRMIHITDYPGFHEQDYYTPGDTGVPIYKTRAGKLGVAICYDRHYPEYMRALALHGADLVVIPQAGTVGEWPDGLYEAECQTAAFQNGYYVALCNRVGEEEGLNFAGESFVCGPDGSVMARAPRGEDHLLLADLDPSRLPGCHARQLFFRDRRPQLYGEWFAE
ncbi:MAG: nitrilase-related carbon-nitrogen hydrolase [Planctomycetota bacterium]